MWDRFVSNGKVNGSLLRSDQNTCRILDDLIMTFGLKSRAEALYWKLHNIDDYPRCVCGKKLHRFEGIKKGYRGKCSVKCAANKDRNEKIKQTNIRKYGGDHWMKIDNNKTIFGMGGWPGKFGSKSFKRGMIKKYGVDNAGKIPRIQSYIGPSGKIFTTINMICDVIKYLINTYNMPDQNIEILNLPYVYTEYGNFHPDMIIKSANLMIKVITENDDLLSLVRIRESLSSSGRHLKIIIWDKVKKIPLDFI